MAYNEVQHCPQTFKDWSSRASSSCNRDTYHCVIDESKRTIEVCAVPQWMKAGHCPVYNTVARKMDSRVCSGNLCPEEVYRSDAVYKYHGCQQFPYSTSMTTSTSVHENTPLMDTSETPIIAGLIASVFIVILLAILGIFFWRKKRPYKLHSCLLCKSQQHSTSEEAQLIEKEPDFAALEKTTPKELDVDKDFIDLCQEYLENWGNTLALYGKLGSGKRTLTAQVAIRLAKKKPKLKIKNVRGKDTISEDLESMQSTILLIDDPVKTWFTSKHTDEIVSGLLKICTNAKSNNSYIIVIFHFREWESLKQHIGKTSKAAMEKMFPTNSRKSIVDNMKKLTEMAKKNNKVNSKEICQMGNASIGDILIMTLYLRHREFQEEIFLSKPTEFIFKKLKTLELSSEFNHRLAFKVMVFMVLQDGKIRKRELDNISRHALFANLKEEMNDEGSIDVCIKHLLELFIEETAGDQCYRILHDVITRCTFIAAFGNHMTLLLKECDPVLILDCIRVLSDHLFYDLINISVEICFEKNQEIAKLFYQRTEMRMVLQNSRILDDKKNQKELKKAERYFTKGTNSSCILS